MLKTPGCQSPGVIRHSPRSGSPDRPSPAVVPFLGPSYPGASKGPLAGSRQSTKHIHHHYIHHHTATGPKSKEQIEAEAAQCIQCLCPPGGADYSDFTPGSVHIQYHLYWGPFTIHIKYTTFTLELCWGHFTCTSHTTTFILGLYLGQ